MYLLTSHFNLMHNLSLYYELLILSTLYRKVIYKTCVQYVRSFNAQVIHEHSYNNNYTVNSKSYTVQNLCSFHEFL